MSHLAALFFGLPWWDLVPDVDRRLLRTGHSEGEMQALAAVAQDDCLAVVYLPGIRTVTIALTRLAGPRVRARWYDPSAGQFFEAAGSPLPSAEARPFRPSRKNAAGYGDWVLVLESLGVG